jgi:hypothetical protein
MLSTELTLTEVEHGNAQGLLDNRNVIHPLPMHRFTFCNRHLYHVEGMSTYSQICLDISKSPLPAEKSLSEFEPLPFSTRGLHHTLSALSRSMSSVQLRSCPAQNACCQLQQLQLC